LLFIWWITPDLICIWSVCVIIWICIIVVFVSWCIILLIILIVMIIFVAIVSIKSVMVVVTSTCLYIISSIYEAIWICICNGFVIRNLFIIYIFKFIYSFLLFCCVICSNCRTNFNEPSVSNTKLESILKLNLE
jgi:hypothetical protein